MYQKIAKFTWSKWHSVNETVPMPSATATPAAGPLQHSAIAHRSENTQPSEASSASGRALTRTSS